MKSERVLARRKALKLTQADIAKAIGVSKVSVSQWEKGDTSPKGENLYALAKVLKCDASWLLTGQGSPMPATNEHVHDQHAKYSAADPSGEHLVALDFYDIEVSAGHGALVIQEEQSDCITFSRKFLEELIGVNTKNVFLMPVRGDSMHPTLKNQAIVMVNKITEFAGDGVYVFRYDGQLMVKRLQFSKTGLTVVSDNSSYKEWELTRDELSTEDFEIIGEVVWSGQKM